MRCLHCNKKLSLLKLAKGDSFCSPEHFDAYQLQQSKDAFQRLMSLKDDDGPKAPLIVKPKEEKAAASEQNPAMARLNALPPPLAAPLSAPAHAPLPTRSAAINVPPYAPFARPPLPDYPPRRPSPVANGPEANAPVEAAREVAFPVHEVASTECLLNLYLQLSLSGIAPRNWESERSFLAAPEDFRLGIQSPAAAFATEFPEIENPAPAEAPEIPAAPVAEAVPFIEPVAPAPAVEAVPEAETIPAFMPVTAAEPLDLASALETLPIEAVPFAENVPAMEPVIPAEPVKLAPAVDAVPPVAAPPRIEAASAAETVPFLMPVRQAEPLSLESLPPLEISEARVPYLVAPSFRERGGASTFVDSEASSVPTASKLDCVLDGSAPRLDSCLEIPRSTRFAAIAELPLRDAAAQWANGAAELPMLPSFVVPDARKHICEAAWSPSERRIGIEQTAVEATFAPTRAVDFDLPAPASLVVQPEAQGFGAADPKKLPGVSPMDAAALMRGVLKTHPLGAEARFIDQPASAMEPGWRARLAPFPDPKPFPGAWQQRTSPCSLPSQLATWGLAPMLPLEARAYEVGCNKIEGIGTAALAAPYSPNDGYRPARWPQAESERPGMVGEVGLVFSSLPTLPPISVLPAGRFETRSRGPVLIWEPSALATKEPPAARFLPVRDSAVLPAPTGWLRLESLPL